MKHKHVELIKAKADNMELVKFYKSTSNGWCVCSNQGCVFDEKWKYYLCLPQHKEECLAWLNGSHIQDYFKGEWVNCKDYKGEDWTWMDNIFMNEEAVLRVAPKKVIKYAIYDKVEKVVGWTFDDKSLVEESLYFANSNLDEERYQLISFEVEE